MGISKALKFTIKNINIDQSNNDSNDNTTAVHGFAYWFDVGFTGPSTKAQTTRDVVLSTSPQAKGTHWKQTIVFLPCSVYIDDYSNDNNVIYASMDLSQGLEDKRHYDIELELLSQDQYEYYRAVQIVNNHLYSTKDNNKSKMECKTTPATTKKVKENNFDDDDDNDDSPFTCNVPCECRSMRCDMVKVLLENAQIKS